MIASQRTKDRMRSLVACGMEARKAAELALSEQAERTAARPKVPSYRAAIDWMVGNDDTDWAQHDDDAFADGKGGSNLSVTACLVADLFGVEHEKVRTDVRAGLRKAGRLQ